MPPSYQRSPLKEFPPLLRNLVRAAEVECPQGHAEALATFIGLALHRVSSCPPFDADVTDERALDTAIETVAKAHYELDQALATWRCELKAAKVALEPDNMRSMTKQSAHGDFDTAYFYAGLAFGLVFAGPYAQSS